MTAPQNPKELETQGNSFFFLVVVLGAKGHMKIVHVSSTPLRKREACDCAAAEMREDGAATVIFISIFQ